MIFFCAELSTNKGVLSMQNIFLWELVRVSDEETKLQGGSNEKIPNYESIASNSLKVIFRTKSSLTMKVQKLILKTPYKFSLQLF